MKWLKQLWDLVTSKSAAFLLAAVGIGVGIYGIWFYRTSAAVAVAASDVKNLPTDVNLHKVAAWTMVCRTILNLDETITKE